MLNWIASNGGYFNAKVDESREGKGRIFRICFFVQFDGRFQDGH